MKQPTNNLRATNMAQAMLKAAQRSIIKSGVPIDKVEHTPSIPWVARRLLTSQSKIGLIKNK